MICCDATPIRKLSLSGEEPAFQRLAVGRNGSSLRPQSFLQISFQASHGDVQAAEHPRRPLAWKAIYALSAFVGTAGRRASFKPLARGSPSSSRRWDDCDRRQREGLFLLRLQLHFQCIWAAWHSIKTGTCQLLVGQSGPRSPRPKKGQSQGAALQPPVLSA